MAEKDVGGEARRVLRLGAPIAVLRIANFFPKAFMLAYVGRLHSGATMVAAAGTATMWCNITGVSLLVGTGLGGATLLSQAYGAKNYYRCGLILQRQMLIHALLICIISWPLALFSETLLRDLLKQPPDTSALAAKFIMWRAPALPFMAINVNISSFLISQGQPRLSALANVVTSLALVPVLATLTRDSGMLSLGFIGAPISLTVAEIIEGCFLVALTPSTLRRADQVKGSNRHYATLPRVGRWRDWRLATRGWCEMLKLGMPAAVMTLAEWFGWESCLFTAGQLCGGETCEQLEAFPIVSQTMVISFMIHYGFATAASARIGNALGAGNADGAKLAAKAAYLITTLIVTVNCSIILLFKERWTGFFVSDSSPSLQSTVSQVLPYVVLYIFFDALGPSASHQVLIGLGHIRFAAVFNVFAFWFVGVPLGIALTKRGLGIEGLWMGLDVGMVLLVAALISYIAFRVNWPNAAATARSKALGETSQADAEDSTKRSSVEIDMPLHQIGNRSDASCFSAKSHATRTTWDSGEESTKDARKSDVPFNMEI